MRALLVRFSAIGDCAMAAHAASCIRRSYTEGTLVWAVEERCAPVVDDASLVTERAIYPRERWKKGAWSAKVWREQMRYYARLRSFKFDIGLDLQGHSKTAICLRLSGAKRRLAVRGTDPLARRLNPVLTDYGGVRHTVDRQLFALRSLGDFPGSPAPIMPELELERRTIRQQLKGDYAAIAVGAGQNWKAYPPDSWAVVARKLIEERIQPVFLGGPGESSPAIEGALDHVGKLDLAHTMAAVAESRLVLAADTGAGHLAAAYGVPVVSVFGPTDPEEFRPYTENGVVLKYGAATTDVKPGEVIEAALKLWRANGAAVPH